MSIHKSVLPKESIENLNLKEGAVVVDATLGGGGHSRAILEKIGNSGTLIAIDLDNQAIENFRLTIDDFRPRRRENIFLVNDNFSRLGNILNSLGIEKVDAILADLGWSSDQMENAHRGMSFLAKAPLDMRLNQTQELIAKKIVSDYSQEELEKVLRNYGEERFARNIARKIVEEREKKEIDTTTELVEIIISAIPEKYKHGKIHPATRTFQALRIEVNQELENLEKFIPQAIEALNPKGRLAIISFHSLEDRIVKNIFKDNAGGCVCPPAMQLAALQEEYIKGIEERGTSAIDLEKALRAGPRNFPQCVCGKIPKVKIITKHLITPGEEEIKNNPRARSAKLRVIEKM